MNEQIQEIKELIYQAKRNKDFYKVDKLKSLLKKAIKLDRLQK